MDRPLRRTRTSRIRTAGVALVALAPVVAVVALVAAPAAQAAPSGTYLVTFVARQCGTYQDITANLARNNIQESLQDLGADTAYVAGQPIAPSVETPNQPNCTPLPGWQFQFGNGINGKTPGTNLSRVSNPVLPALTAQASVPLLDANGTPTGATIAGAVTTTLTPSQVTQAANHQLWAQGGTTTDPLGSAAFGAGTYGFGALRCAVDNLNGDNVEWVGFPSGQTHVFCYYYAVTPPKPAATVTVTKQLGNGAVSPEVFHFRGSISYNSPNGDFTASTSSPITFVRASQTPWNFRELVPNPNHPTDPTDLFSPDFNFASVSCTSTLGTSTINGVGFSAGSPYVSTTDPEITNLVAGPGDAVTCTYTDDPAVTQLSLFKQTVGGVGGPFPITVTPPSGPALDLSATTLVDSVPVLVGTTTDAIPPGGATYDVSEQLPPATGAGSWALSSLECNGSVQTADPSDPLLFHVMIPASVPAPADTPFDCLLTNTFTPTGSITITKTTVGGTGTVEFAVVPTTPSGQGDTADPVYSATTTQAGVAATATKVSGDYSLDSLDLGQYSIVESGPDDTAAGSWAPQPVTCNGVSTDPTTSDVLVTLTVADPHVTCAFTNAFTAIPPTPTTTTTPVASTTTSTTPGGVAGGDTGLGGGGLAMTGEDIRLPLGIAGVLAVIGTALLLADRARRRPTPVTVPVQDDPSTR